MAEGPRRSKHIFNSNIMADQTIILPSKPKIVTEEGNKGVYEIENLYPGYGHTLGNSLRRIILASLPGTAITSVKIDGVEHEFSTISGVKEDVIALLLNLKQTNFRMISDEPQEITLQMKGAKTVTAADLQVPGGIEVVNPDNYICELTDAKASLTIILTVEKGLGYVPKEVLQKDKVEIGTIALDAVFTPIRRVNYESENMRVGDRTDYNRLRIFIETNGTIPPREALERSVAIMIRQLQAIADFQTPVHVEEEVSEGTEAEAEKAPVEEDKEAMKTRIDSLEFSTRTQNALEKANIRTIGGLARKSEKDLLELEGLGDKGVKEIKRALSNFGITLK